MRNIIKRVASTVLIPVVRWYLRKERTYRNGEIRIKVLPGVFHPGLFSSTEFLFRFLSEQNLKGASFLELGCGSGFLSIAASKAGAEVTASDFSALAIRGTTSNAVQNNVKLNIIHSDLFDSIGPAVFDWIVINPPYYAQAPVNEEELAWKCGENFEYYYKLFEQLPGYTREHSFILMVLTLGCDLTSIFSIADQAGFRFELLREKAALFDEKDFLYRIRPTHAVNSIGSSQA
jgi:release factor glutamine methyltransferase